MRLRAIRAHYFEGRVIECERGYDAFMEGVKASGVNPEEEEVQKRLEQLMLIMDEELNRISTYLRMNPFLNP